ncbi:adhesin [Yersinia aleksiciae]|uniref:adhesin n=1 Tax=Yersinia aleksiciae TaxID=263819 RepID=UPI00119FF44A|nr:adhesin [Yersinia aleksiciae]
MKGDKYTGWEHVVERHFSGKTNASQFSISQQELRAILQDKSSVQTPMIRTIPSNDSPRYERVIDVGKPIGFDKFSGGGQPQL